MESEGVVKTPFVIAITSGKGGVGKSVLASNIAYTLSQIGNRTLLWDANRSFPNCHLLLGVEPPIRLSDVYAGLVPVDKAIFSISENLHLLADAPGGGINSYDDTLCFIDIYKDLLLETNFDVIIIDSPAGYSQSTIEIADIADEVHIMITDEPTSLLDGYGLIKLLKELIPIQRFKLLVNNVIDYDDGNEISQKLNLATEKFLGFSIEVSGLFPYSRAVRQSIIRQELFVEAESDDEISKAVLNFSHKIHNKLIETEAIEFSNKLIEADSH